MSGPMVDLQAYLERIGYRGDLTPSYAVLEALHLAHATHIPFENLDIQLGRPIHLDLEHLQAKLIRAGRGGYCFEQNLLFAAVLEQLGFRLLRLAARVRYGTERTLPRTHMLLLVDVDGSRWLADVGFGADGLLHPVPFDPGQISRQFLWSYRVIERSGVWILQSIHDGSWVDLYGFTLEPQEQVDYEMANHFTSTHPNSRFVQTLTAQFTSPQKRVTLRNRELVVDTGTAVTTRTLADDAEVLEVLSNVFNLPLPAGTQFKPPRNQA